MSSHARIAVSVLDVRRARREHRDPSRHLLDVAMDVLAEVPYAQVSLETVAARAGTTTTALCAHYRTKDALIAEIYLHRLRNLPLEIDAGSDVVTRLNAQVQVVALLFAAEPHLSLACNIALMRNDDPAIAPVRQAISAEIQRRIAAALGSGAWPEIHSTLETVICGALLQVGAGMLSYHRMIEHVDTMFGLLLPDA